MQQIFIAISSALLIICIVPYIVDVVRRKSKPRIVSWFNWTLLSIISSFASFSDHQYAAAILLLVSTIECAAITALGVIYEGEKSIAKFDIECQVAALTGLALWLIFNSPSIAVIATIIIDLIASLPTLKHAWEKPLEETHVTFLLGGVGAVFTILAATSFRITAVAGPIYIAAINLLIFSIIITRRRTLRTTQGLKI